MTTLRLSACILCLVPCLCVSSASADDWPQWMGPGRDNVWREDGIIAEFPDGGPKVLWRAPVAGGYAGPAVAGGKVFVTDYVTSDDVKVPNFERKDFSGIERVLCLDAASGKQLWKHEYPVKYDISYPAGPRCTPVVHDGRVYTLGAEGQLACLDVAEGKVLWSKDLTKEYSTKTALWGYASHPLIDGDLLICVVGGEGSHAVAFDRKTGEERWRALSAKEQGYSPPTIIEAGGARQLILLRPGAVTSVDPATGKEHWSVPYEATNGSVIMAPIRSEKHLFVGGFSNKNLLLELDADKPAANVVWRDLVRHGLAPVNVQPFADGKVFYGFDQGGAMHGVEFETGKRLWTSTGPIDGGRAIQVATAFIVRQGDRFWLFNELGELVIAKLSAEGYTELDRAKVIEPSNLAFGRKVVWSAPAFANRRAYVRNDAECICVDLAAPTE